MNIKMREKTRIPHNLFIKKKSNYIKYDVFKKKKKTNIPL